MGLFLILFFAVTLVFVGWAYGDTSSPEEFNMAGRKANLWHVGFGAFTVVGAGEYVGITQYGYFVGFYAVALTIGFAAGAQFLRMYGASAYNIARSHNLDSLPDYVALRYGRIASLLTSLVSVLALGCLLTIQLAVGGAALSALLDIPYSGSVIGIGVVVAAYVCFGGLKAIFLTDILQGGAMLIFLLVLLAASGAGLDSPSAELAADSLTQVIETFPPLQIDGSWSNAWFIAVLFVSGAFAISGGADVWQRMFAAQDETAFKRGFSTTSILYLIFGILLSLIAVHIAQTLPKADSATAFVQYIQTALPQWLLAIAVVGVFAGAVSTADAETLVLGVVLSRELKRWNLNTIIEVKDSQIAVLLITSAAVIAGILYAQILGPIFSILLFLLMVTGPVAWMALFGRGNSWTANIGILGSLGIMAWLWNKDLILIDGWALLIPLPVFICLLTRAKPIDDTSKLVDRS